MNASALVADLTARGCTLAIEGDRVRVRGPRKLLTPEVVEALRNRKGELLELLSGSHRAVKEQAALLRVAGDVAEAIHRHCSRCRLCRAAFFVGEAPPLPLCPEGRELRRRYREARRLALGGRGGGDAVS